jgi:hypothetical protein
VLEHRLASGQNMNNIVWVYRVRPVSHPYREHISHHCVLPPMQFEGLWLLVMHATGLVVSLLKTDAGPCLSPIATTHKISNNMQVLRHLLQGYFLCLRPLSNLYLNTKMPTMGYSWWLVCLCTQLLSDHTTDSRTWQINQLPVQLSKYDLWEKWFSHLL